MISRLLEFNKRPFTDLSEQELLALAISSEEDDARIYQTYAEGLRDEFPGTARLFDDMAAQEHDHRRWLLDLHQEKFGDNVPLIRREHVRGYYPVKPLWLVKPYGIDKIREQASEMEAQAWRFYTAAAARAEDASIRRLMGDLAEAEAAHVHTTETAMQNHTPQALRDEERDNEHKQFVLTYIQPGLAGLMDGSVSTLAPIFATAFATQDTWTTFLVGIAASLGAGISMGFTEVASDDGVISGRGSPIKRGLATGIMTTVGGLGHALPYLIPNFKTATIVAIIIVFIELWAITWIQNRFMQTPWRKAIFQVVLGGALVFAAGVLIGGS